MHEQIAALLLSFCFFFNTQPMTIWEFNKLTKQQQKILLLTKGAFIDERATETFDVMLYELDGIYAEVFFFSHSNKLAFIKALSSVDDLQPYLQAIDVSELLQEAFS